ncbi:MAG: putative Ig domain-containing protein, partial [Gammaproteobacteria bacterium]|nr:putative Ig domain-containing protein [Gammaproteobacteria bacterium]
PHARLVTTTPVEECELRNNQTRSALVQLRATDPTGLVDIQRFAVSVDEINDPPVIVSDPVTAATSSFLYRYPLQIDDPDIGDGHSYSLSLAPAGMFIDSLSGLITWVPTSSQVGTHAVTVSVVDLSGASAEQSFSVNVVAGTNLPPTIQSAPIEVALEAQEYLYDVQADDPNLGDVLDFSLRVSPAGMTIDPATGIIRWQPPADFVQSVAENDPFCVDPNPIGPPALLDLSNWTQVTTAGSHFNLGFWQLGPDNTSVSQIFNGSPSMFVSDFDFVNDRIQGTFRTDNSDNDHMGFVWGYQDAQHYYRFDWRMDVFRMRVTLINSPIPTFEGVGEGDILLYQNDSIGWQWSVDYQFELDFRPGRSEIWIREGDTLIDHIVIEDDTFVDGKFGFYNHSQPASTYTASPAGPPPLPDLRVGRLGLSVIGDTQTLSAQISNRGLAGIAEPFVVRFYNGNPANGGQFLGESEIASLASGGSVSAEISGVPLNVITRDVFVRVENLGAIEECHVDNNIARAGFVEVAATDTGGLSDTQRFLVSVDDVNEPPAIDSTPEGTATTGLEYRYQLRVSDPDVGDSHQFALTLAPAGMGIDARTGLVTWTPDVSQSGFNDVIVSVTDLRGASAEQSFTLQVIEGNAAPVITSIPATQAFAGTAYSYQVVADDPDGDALTYVLDVAPAGMQIDAFGLITWTPGFTQIGIRNVSVRVSDGRGGFALQNFGIQVTSAANDAPVFISAPPLSASVGQRYSYSAQAVDADGDPLTFSLASAPAGMTVTANSGLVQWTPAASQQGLNNVTLRVEDGRGGIALQQFTLAVNPAGVGNRAPVIVSVPITQTGTGIEYVYQVEANDADGDPLSFTLDVAPFGMQIDVDGLITWTPTDADAGNNPVSVRVTDGQGGADTQSYNLLVIADSDNQAPVFTNVPPPLSAKSGLTYLYDPQVVDPDGDPLVHT